MKRAVAYIICSPFLQLHKTPHDIMDIDAVLNVLYGLLGNQGLLLTDKIKIFFRLSEVGFRWALDAER